MYDVIKQLVAIFKRSQVMRQFRLYRLKGMLVAVALHIFRNHGAWVKTVFRKSGHKADGGQIVKSYKICVFMFSQRISLRNWNRISRPKDTQTLILFALCLLFDHTRL